MVVPSASGPDDLGPLSSREKEILTGIEDDLSTTDPALAETMTGRGSVDTWPWSPLRPKRRSLVIVTVVVLLVAVVLLPASWWVLLGLTTTL